MKKANIFLSALCFVIFVTGCSTSRVTSQPPQNFDYSVDPQAVGVKAGTVAEIDELLQSFVDEKKAGNLAAFAAKDGKVFYAKAFGWKDVESQVPASLDDYYVLFSQTKAVVTVAFMTLVERGLVAVDDPVAKYFPQISNQVATKINDDGTYETRAAARPMTFAHLMSHSSGIGA